MPYTDLLIIGAGAAGIAAARAASAAGASVLVLEARERVGGRAVTRVLRGHPVDLGAHWLHAGPINPLVALAIARGERLRRAPQDSHLVIERRMAGSAEHRSFGRAFDLADRGMTRSGALPGDRAAAALPPMGRFGGAVAAIHGLVCGRPLAEVSLADFPSLEYAKNWFVAGGYGGLVARLAEGLPIRLGVRVEAITHGSSGVTVTAGRETFRAAAAMVTVPPVVMARNSIVFSPKLPPETAKALAAFRPGIYEHVVLHWPSSPFRWADRLASFVGFHPPFPGMLTRIDGTPLHYLELDLPLAARRGPIARARLARALVEQHLGRKKLHDLRVLHVTDWAADPLAGGSWGVLGPGDAGARAALAEPVEGRLFFAGEWADPRQWGTVGGAWWAGEQVFSRFAAVHR